MALQQHCPTTTLLSITHPACVRDTDRAIQTLGGPEALRKIADDPITSTLELRFRPGDRFEHPVMSSTARTANLLIKVQKRINEQGLDYLEHDPVAMVKCSIRFRDMSDFQWNTSNSKFFRRLKDPLATRDVQKLAAFVLSKDETDSSDELDLLPPPIFSTTVVPHTYNYTQNPAAKKTQTDAGIRLVNRTRGLRQHLITMVFEDGEVPLTHSQKLPSRPSAEIADIIVKLEKIFADRPIWTRRGVTNMLGQTTNFHNIKFALPYVSYMWRSGPWRDCYVRFGLDPRSDPCYGDYQAIYCMSKAAPTEDGLPHEASQSHIFDGKTLYPRGRTFMFCDMTDPILTQIRQRAIKRSIPHLRDGWWRAKMLQASRNILRGKLNSLCAGVIPSDLDYTTILEHANDPDDEFESLADLDVPGGVAEEDIIEQEAVDPALEDDKEYEEEEVEDLDSHIKVLMKSLVRPGDTFNDGTASVAGERHQMQVSGDSSSDSPDSDAESG